MSSVLLTWSDVEPDHEAAFHRWYDEVQIPNCLQAKHWSAVQRFRLGGRYTTPDNQNPICPYLALWEFDTDDFDAIFMALHKQFDERPWEAFAPIKHRFRSTYTALAPKQFGPGKETRPWKTQGLLLTWREVEPQHDEAFNRWYEHSLTNHLQSRHWMAGTRYRSAGPYAENQNPICQYLAIWELDTDDFYEAYVHLSRWAEARRLEHELAESGQLSAFDADMSPRDRGMFEPLKYQTRATLVPLGERRQAHR